MTANFFNKAAYKASRSVFLRTSIAGSTTATILSALCYSTNGKESINSVGVAPKWALNFSVACMPKVWTDSSKFPPAALDCCGEDAFAVAENDYQIVLGIADGVGSWRSNGIDPSGFSRSLMRNLEKVVIGEQEGSHKGILGKFIMGTSTIDPPTGTLSAIAMLKSAFWKMVKEYHSGREKPFGSSTACILSMDKATGELDACNLGDSGYMLIRDNRILVRSVPQQHRFNAPYQLALTPEGDIHDCSPMAATESIQLEKDDILILATDGLWDNLFDQDIISEELLIKSDLKKSVENLVKKTRIAASQKDYESPFCIEARKSGLKRLGGKMDDITIVVAKVTTT